jgi:phosphotriesterase-related protein
LVPERKREGIKMDMSSLQGKVNTVLGPVDSRDLGVILPHEHLLVDMSVYFSEPKTNSDKLIAYAPLSIENLRWVKYHLRYHLDNARLWDEKQAIEELTRFKLAGGGTLVDQTSVGLGRDPNAIARISRATGIHVVMGAGHYVTSPNDPTMDRKSEDQLYDEIMSDVRKGAMGTDIKPGFIGEVGCSWPLRDSERKALRAAGRAQKETGFAVNVHPSRNEKGPKEALDALLEVGANPKRVVISHMDRCGYALETRLELLDMGCYVEYDIFGTEGWYPPEAALADDHLPNILNDVARVREIAELIGKGYLRQILISQDICYKIALARWGGPGYAHILENVVPLMRVYGYTEEQINALIKENPRDMLTGR